jgi:hypothetical protein
MPVHVPAMKIDVLGRIRNVPVPVFETVVNSIRATEERFAPIPAGGCGLHGRRQRWRFHGREPQRL